MNVEIHFQADYAYQEAVSFSIHLFRLFPRAGRDLRVVRADFHTNDDAAVTYRRDLFDNEVASAWYPERAEHLKVDLQLELAIAERNPFAFILAPSAIDFPFTYEPHVAPVLAPYLANEQDVPALPFWSPPAEPAPTVATLVELNRAFREHLQYERREEGTARTPAETVQLGSGACRDFSVLFAATLRRLGIAARLVSGYLVESESADRRAEGALHAWVDAYLPGAGWIGFDPTNGVLCDHRHIPAAVGLNSEHIAPTLGRYFHKTQVSSTMTSSLTLRELSAKPKRANRSKPKPRSKT